MKEVCKRHTSLFEQISGKARTACFNSSQRIDNHFVDVTDMIEVGTGRPANGRKYQETAIIH
jgi:hypothetical protein